MLDVGDHIPNFSLKDQHGKLREIKEFLNEKQLVLFFYPMDFTPGCTKQVCGLRDEFSDLSARGIQVVGISRDGVKRHKKFSDEYRVPFVLLSDSNNRVRRLFGLKGKWLGLLPNRTTFIVGSDGHILKVLDAQFEIEQHIKFVLSQNNNNTTQ